MSILCSIHQLALIFPEKICFNSFNAAIYAGQKIAVIGDNGCGKTSLLQMIAGKYPVFDGEILFHQQTPIGYVLQTPESLNGLSGAQCFQQGLSEALSNHPGFLILDEPTNHLDSDNRRKLLQFLQYYSGTLLISSHDKQLLNLIPDCLWSIQNGELEQFDGKYEDFLREKERRNAQMNKQMSRLKQEKKTVHKQLMQEQQRAKNAKEKGKKSIKNRKWPTIVSHAKMHRGSLTSGKKGKEIREQHEEIISQMGSTNIAQVLVPKFDLPSGFISNKPLVVIKNGVVGYQEKMFSHKIDFQLYGQDRLAIIGDNGSGKSTLVKAIMGQAEVLREGEWQVPSAQEIGYLDQYYQQLSLNDTLLSSLENLRSDWTHQQIRSHLNDFLFKSNTIVNQSVDSLSGGEKARFSLSLIAAKPPKLLILDEVTNNLDITTRDHVVQCLKKYPGAIIVISHDEDFLEQININDFYVLN